MGTAFNKSKGPMDAFRFNGRVQTGIGMGIEE
eukprot:CAMPEP_0167810492 /NCGR_PEP_ID=MMETSP0112_2-20121227/114_1 /TAXON_ID=91324 /ORGANISM="Lotharella globosa, Strain CCCM811" /LENGTH=31 /DNA_ID= /DNA_START= /DNA_END= /DNA_ORIENTATION=